MGRKTEYAIILPMANSIEGLNIAREGMIEDAVFPVLDALMLLEDAGSDRGVSIGQINNTIRKFNLDEEAKTGMGMGVEALDRMVDEGDVMLIETPVDRTKNGHIIGTPDWKARTYRLVEPPSAAIEY